MDILKKYGKLAAVALIGAGLLLILYAWFDSPKAFSARVRTFGEERVARVNVSDQIAASWLQQADIRLYPGDAILYSGIEIAPAFRLPAKQGQSLTYKRAVAININQEGIQRVFYSSAATLGEALWEQGIFLSASDSLSLPLGTPLREALQVELNFARIITIQVGNVSGQISTSASTIGEALVEAGLPLQFLDISQPAEEQPLPEDGIIRLTRVREEVLLEESPIPYSEERLADSEMVIGQSEVRQAGISGVQISSVRVRYENDDEVSRAVEQQWVAQEPVPQITAYGGKVVIQTASGTDCLVDYWLAKEVVVKSYHDTGSPTASGIWPYYGVIAVSPEWYSILRGSSICVPGYGVGTVLDVCPGCSGRNWIDVFIPTADYVPWNKTVTVYFMPPVPSGFSGDLP